MSRSRDSCRLGGEAQAGVSRTGADERRKQMKAIRIIGVAVLGVFAMAAIATASASAELPEYMLCGKAAKVDKVYVGHYASSLCTEESKVEGGGEYELEKGFGKKATFAAKS